VSRAGDSLELESRWGKWKAPVRLIPCDADDPAFFSAQLPGTDPAYVAFERDPDGQVIGLRLDDLVYMHRRSDAD
jgi:hypothetical protein